jgi:uncharacterized membrane protein YqhA
MGSFGQAREVTAAVMGATDASLFGVVLIIFADAIAFGFMFQLGSKVREKIPEWMQVDNISEHKHALIEVIIVYLAADFAIDLAAGGSTLTWETLVKPVSITLLAATLRLMAVPQPHEHQRPTGEPLQILPAHNKDAPPHPKKSLRP